MQQFGALQRLVMDSQARRPLDPMPVTKTAQGLLGITQNDDMRLLGQVLRAHGAVGLVKAVSARTSAAQPSAQAALIN
jgi:hypothetical protein